MLSKGKSGSATQVLVDEMEVERSEEAVVEESPESDEEVRRTSCWMSWEGMLACAESMGGRFVSVGFAIPTEEMPSFPHEVDGNHRNAGVVPG